jgi:hypothetical protein
VRQRYWEFVADKMVQGLATPAILKELIQTFGSGTSGPVIDDDQNATTAPVSKPVETAKP